MGLRLASERWDIAPEPALSGYTIEWVEQDCFRLSRGEMLYEARSLQGPPYAARCVPWVLKMDVLVRGS